MSKGTQELLVNQNKASKNGELENDSDFDGDFEYENDKEKIVEQSPKGRFIRFNEELGTGAYKTVYKAYDNDSGCEVAWNVIKLQRLPPKERKRISDEIALLKSLKHPNIIHFISAWINRRKDEVVFITEIVTGGSLKNYLKKIKSPRLKVMKSWCREILQGLEYLHTMSPNPIIHRDLKCENIFINSNKGEIRIGDLGLATCMSASFANSVLGTPHFMAPEMYEENYGTSVDIYSFGMCFLEMVTQQTPYKECENPAQVYKKVMSGKKPQSLDLILNEDVKNFILECLQDKDERPTATDLLQSKFLTQSDENDNFPVKLLDFALTQAIEEENSSEVSKTIDKPRRDGFLPVNPEDLEQKDSPARDEETKSAEQKSKSIANEKSASEHQSEVLPNSLLGKDDNTISPHRLRDQLIGKRGEDDSAYTYELSIKSIIKSYICINVKIESQELHYLNQKLIQIDRRKFTVDTLIAEVMKRFEIQMITPRLFQAISAFMENSEFVLPVTYSKAQNNSNFTVNTSYSTANLNNTTKIYETINTPFAERGISALPNNTNTYFFQSEFFLSYYQQYLNCLPKDYYNYETEDLMTLRHNAEIIELQKAHIMQKKLLLDRRQAHLNNLQLPGLSVDFNPKENDEAQKNARTPIGGDPMLFSPFSSGYISPDEAVLNDDGDLSSHNNSVEIMSIIGKLNPHNDGKHAHQNDGAGEEFSKSSLILTSGDINLPYNYGLINGGGNNNLSVNSVNSYLNVQGFNGTNGQSHINSKLTPMISPKGGSESNSQLFGSHPKRVVLQDSSQKKGFSPTLGDHQQQQQQQQSQPRRIQAAAYSTQSLNTATIQGSDPTNKATSPSEFTAALAHVQQMRKPSNERAKIKKQSSYDPPPNETNENELTLNRACHSELTKGSAQPSVHQKQNLLPKGIWIDTGHHHDPQPKEGAGLTPNPDTADTLRVKISPNSNNSLKTISFGSGDFIQDQLRSPLIKTLATAANENKVTDRGNEKPQDKLIDKPAETEVPKTNLHAVANSNAQTSYPPAGDIFKPSPSKKIRTKSPSFNLVNRGLSINVPETQNKEPVIAASNNYTNLVSPKSVQVINISILQSQLSPKGEFPIEKTIIKENLLAFNPQDSRAFLDSQIKSRDQLNSKELKVNPTLMEKIRMHKLRSELRREGQNMNEEDVKIVQACLEVLANTPLEANGHFGHYTDKLLKSYQEKNGILADGIVTEQLWERMKEDCEKKLTTRTQDKEREIKEIANKALEDKKIVKEKQIKEAQESLNKIQSELIDLSML